MSVAVASRLKKESNHTANKMADEDRAVHDWYRFVLSFPPHLVKEYLCKWDLPSTATVLDPFCGTGTTVVEAKKMGFSSIGIEANPVVHFASQTKTDWSVNPNQLIHHAQDIITIASQKVAERPYRALSTESENLLLQGSMSAFPTHKCLSLYESIENAPPSDFTSHEKLAFAKIAVGTASNLRFGPEVGVGTRQKLDAHVLENWLCAIEDISNDIQLLSNRKYVPSNVILGDARFMTNLIERESIDAVFTSPPYPNEKDYSRTTRLEMVLLGYIHNKSELQQIKRGFLRSNTRNVYKGDNDDCFVEGFSEIQAIATEIERRRIEMNKTSGFERLYAKVTKLYFGGMMLHLSNLRPFLRSGAYLGYVVGDQASYLRVMIPTGKLLACIAESLGYEVVSIDLFRTRLSTTTKEMMREEVVVLRWHG
jgi:phospholipid N-methyltransferase